MDRPEEPGEWVEGPGERLISPGFSDRWGRACVLAVM